MIESTIEAFRAELIEQGYEVGEREWEAGQVNHMHTHPFYARGLITRGTFTVTHAEGAKTYRPGDQFRLEADIEHEEVIGPEGVSFISGRRAKG